MGGWGDYNTGRKVESYSLMGFRYRRTEVCPVKVPAVEGGELKFQEGGQS